jgi:hypothetical protein
MELLASDETGAVVLYECMDCGFQNQENVENVLEEPLEDEEPNLLGDHDEDDEPFPGDAEDTGPDPDDEDLFDEDEEDLFDEDEDEDKQEERL